MAAMAANAAGQGRRFPATQGDRHQRDPSQRTRRGAAGVGTFMPSDFPLERAASQLVDARGEALIEATIAELALTESPSIAAGGTIGRAAFVAGIRYQLAHLSEALAWSSPELFVDGVSWARVALRRRGIADSDIDVTLRCLDRAIGRELDAELDAEHAARARSILDAGLSRLSRPAPEPATYLSEGAPLVSLARQYLATLLRYDRAGAARLILDAVESGTSVRDVYLGVFMPCQSEVGRLWQLNRLDVAQEHYCTAATQLVMSMIQEHAPRPRRAGRTVVAAAAIGERHDLGIRMVADFFEMAGWDAAYLGADTPARGLTLFVDEVRADALALSVTMTTSLRGAAATIDAVRSADLRRCPLILVGGYPFGLAPDLWKRVGADACARDADDAVATANRLLG